MSNQEAWLATIKHEPDMPERLERFTTSGGTTKRKVGEGEGRGRRG